jgi:antitoxin VapB
MSQIAKLFKNGRSQAVRLPASFRFEGHEVFIRRDPETGDVILSRRPDSWDGFFAALDEAGVPDDFLGAAERQADPPERDPFEDWSE